MPLSAEDQAKIDELKAMTLAGEGVRVCELVAVTWPAPDGLVYYANIQADEAYPDIIPHLGGAPVDVRLKHDEEAPFSEVVHEEGISDDIIELDFWDADGVISDLAHEHGAGVRVEVFYYYPDVDLLLSMWWGHLEPAQSADQERYKTTAEQGFRSAQLPLPRRAFYAECQAVDGLLLQTQAEIDEGDCPRNMHIGGDVGVPGMEFHPCPRRNAQDCIDHIGDSLSILSMGTVVESIVNNQTKGPAVLATSRGNENNLKRPLRVIAGARQVRDLDLLAFTPQINNNHPEDGFVRVLEVISEGPNKSVGRCQVNDEIFPADQVQVRLGEKRQAPTGFSPSVPNYSGTSLFFGVYGQVNPEDYSDPDSLKGQCFVEGLTDVRVYADPEDPESFTEGYSTDRAWWLLHILRHKRWGLGLDVARLELADWIALSAWASQIVTHETADGQTLSGQRTDFNAELIDRTAQQQINDLCQAGRFGLPFPQFGKLRVVPLRKLTEEELAAAPAFTDYGPDRNIDVDDETEKSSVTRSEMSDKELPNRVVVTFDDAAHGHVQRPLSFEDQPQQLRAGRAFGDTSRRAVDKKYGALGVTTYDEAARLGNYLLDLGPFDDGGLRNNLRITFRTWHTLALDLHKYQVIKVLSHQLERYGFQYFRIRHIRFLPDLKVELSCQAYADSYVGDTEVGGCVYGALLPVVYETFNHAEQNGDGDLLRDGGVPGTSDAWAKSEFFVEGDSCGYWEMRTFFDEAGSNDQIVFVIEDEFGGANRYGWFLTNDVVNFRRAPYHGTTSDLPIYYGPEGSESLDQVGFNVGFRFGIYYHNGTVTLYENVQFTEDTNDFAGGAPAPAGAGSYTYTGLPTDRRWRLRVYVFNETSKATKVKESSGPYGVTGTVVADAGADKSAGLGEQVILDGTASTASGAGIASYLWEWVSGPVGVSILGTGATRLIRPAQVGTYVFRLTVYGERGATDSDTVTVTVAELDFLIDRDGETVIDRDGNALYDRV